MLAMLCLCCMLTTRLGLEGGPQIYFCFGFKNVLNRFLWDVEASLRGTLSERPHLHTFCVPKQIMTYKIVCVGGFSQSV